jgi:predicted GIY-YIG superfamily endonuclease
MARDDTAVYILKLAPREDENARWYVGITDDPERRFHQHRNTGSVEWIQRNEIVDQFVLGYSSRRYAEKIEELLTGVLMLEFGRDSTRGAGYTNPDLISFPDVARKELPPGVAERFEEIDDPELSQLAEYSACYASIEESITFSDTDEAIEWADEHLPPGIEVSIREPAGGRRYTFSSQAPDDPSSD